MNDLLRRVLLVLMVGCCALAAEYRIIPAARTSELTPAAGDASPAQYRDWPRSHGNNTNARYSSLGQINRANVKRMAPAWTYRSKDGGGNLECNPIIVKGVMYAPTAGQHMVAIDAATGREIWRFKPDGRPVAFRGLVYWPGEPGVAARI